MRALFAPRCHCGACDGATASTLSRVVSCSSGARGQALRDYQSFARARGARSRRSPGSGFWRRVCDCDGGHVGPRMAFRRPLNPCRRLRGMMSRRSQPVRWAPARTATASGARLKRAIFFNDFKEMDGGDRGIRTLDRALQPYNGLANRRLQPLGHISVTAAYARQLWHLQVGDCATHVLIVDRGDRIALPFHGVETWHGVARISGTR